MRINNLRMPVMSLAVVGMLSLINSQSSTVRAQTVFVANDAGSTTTAYTILKY